MKIEVVERPTETVEIDEEKLFHKNANARAITFVGLDCEGNRIDYSAKAVEADDGNILIRVGGIGMSGLIAH